MSAFTPLFARDPRQCCDGPSVANSVQLGQHVFDRGNMSDIVVSQRLDPGAPPQYQHNCCRYEYLVEQTSHMTNDTGD